MPVRNEAEYIKRSLSAVLKQDYPSDRIEVIVADGISTDETRQIVQSFQPEYPNLKLVDNPSKLQPFGLNAAMLHARGEVIVRVDGHCEISHDYVSRCVHYLKDKSVDGVGGPLETIGETSVARTIASAICSPFGVGNSSFRTVHNKTMLVDTIAFPAYTRSIMLKAGPHDEEMSCNEDDEYNYRLRKLGAKLLLAEDVHAKYYCRSNLQSLFRQYFRYGFWKVRLMQKHPGQMQFRHFVPLFFVVALLIAGVSALFLPFSRILLALIMGSYVLAVFIASFLTARKSAWRNFLILPFVFSTLHFSYGLGFLIGIVSFWRYWKK